MYLLEIWMNLIFLIANVLDLAKNVCSKGDFTLQAKKEIILESLRKLVVLLGTIDLISEL